MILGMPLEQISTLGAALALEFELIRIGIDCYFDLLVGAGFDTWEVLQDINELDM